MSGEKIPYHRILVPLDGSDSSFKAAKYAVKLAKLAGAKLIFMHAVANPPYVEFKSAGIVMTQYIEAAKKYAEGWFAMAGEIASKEGLEFSNSAVLDVASIPDTIVNFAADKKADLIVMGTKGRTGLKRVLLGSVASGVVSHATCAVLVVR